MNKKITPLILNIRSCSSLDGEILKDLEAIETNKTIAELIDEKRTDQEEPSEKKTQ